MKVFFAVFIALLIAGSVWAGKVDPGNPSISKIVFYVG